MDQREANRRAARHLAGIAETCARGMFGPANSVNAALGPDDRARIMRAFTKLAAELTTRGAGPPPAPIDPNQMTIPDIETECCQGTGFADYASVPCPAPGCPAVAKLAKES